MPICAIRGLDLVREWSLLRVRLTESPEATEANALCQTLWSYHLLEDGLTAQPHVEELLDVITRVFQLTFVKRVDVINAVAFNA